VQTRWVGKNVDLNPLCECAEDFFKDKGFVTKKYESRGEHTILCTPQRVKNINKTIKVRIFGEPNDFVIEFKARESTRRSIWLGMLTKSIGGGYFILRGSKLHEALEGLEKEFWAYMQDKVANRGRSTEHS